MHHLTGMLLELRLLLRPLLVLNKLDIVSVELLSECVLDYAAHVLELTLQRL